VKRSVFTRIFCVAIFIGFCELAFSIPGTQEPTYKIGDSALPMEPIAWLQGEPVTKYEPGRVYVVEFWATWCPPCIKTIPHLSEIQKKYANTLTVVGVNADGLLGFEGNVDKVHDFMIKHGKEMQYAVAMEDLAKKTMSKAWISASGSLGAPVAFIIDMRGKLAWVGYPDLVQSYAFDQALEDTLAGKTDLARARALQVATDRESARLVKAGETP
jgi:thiol-disulfide isomerase/thioredoxin